MVFGTGKFKCKDCNCKFISSLAEFGATIFRVPISPCPNCGSWNMKPIGLTRFNLYLRLPKSRK